MIVRRLDHNPILHRDTHPSLGGNINGPSLIRVPDWVEGALARYYLYFAHHQGQFIRLAVADDLAGPWRIHEGGVLHLDQTVCSNHIASPDVHIFDQTRTIRMYFHGPRHRSGQLSFVAQSNDGLHFTASPTALGPFYFRVFQYGGVFYALAKTDPYTTLLRSPDGLGPFEPGPHLLERARHTALRRRGDVLDVFYSRIGDEPESILWSQIDLNADWHHWQERDTQLLLEPTLDWEGGDLPTRPSRPGAIHERARELRDPAVFDEDGRTWLIYSIAGESGLAIAELTA